MRRLTRRTNTFSKKLENLERTVALYFMYYNFAHNQQSLRVIPAMEVGIIDYVWSLDEAIRLLSHFSYLIQHGHVKRENAP